jgi:cold shock CspA family protein
LLSLSAAVGGGIAGALGFKENVLMNQNHKKGKLKRWNDDKGFGFITSDDGKDIFIHISALKRMERRPQVGDVIIYQIDTGNDGKEKAVNAKIEGVAEIRARPARKNYKRRRKTNLVSAILFVVLIVSIGSFAYNRFAALKPLHKASTTSTYSHASQKEGRNNYSCEGKVYCSEMTSCDEAKYYQRNCPGTKMDGDDDGIPCESQWCGW